jgi:hypothetical protein
MAGEQSVHEANFVDEKKTERDADHARRNAQSLIEASEAFVRISKRENHGAGDEHHPGNRADPEDEQINNRPFRITNRGKDQQRYGGGAGEAMYETHHQRPHDLIEAQLAEMTVEPIQRRLLERVRMSFGFVLVRMRVNVIVVTVRVRMACACNSARGSNGAGDPLEDTGEVQDAQENEHQAHGKLHREAHARRNYPAEENDSTSHDQDRERMADSPKHTNQRSMADLSIARDDSGDGDDVVGIGGVAHPEKESKSDDGEQADHFRASLLTPRSGATPTSYTLAGGRDGVGRGAV